MKLKGIKKACTETRYCSKHGTYSECEIAINIKTGQIYATCRYGINNWSSWHDTDIVNLFYTRRPMTMQQLRDRIEDELSFTLLKFESEKE